MAGINELITPERVQPSKMDDVEVAKYYVRKAINAGRAGNEFKLTFAQFKRIVKVDTCPVFGIPMMKTMAEVGNGDDELTIDRLDNTKGYTVDNSIAISCKANQAKSIFEGNKQFTFDDARAVFRWVEEEFKKRGDDYSPPSP